MWTIKSMKRKPRVNFALTGATAAEVHAQQQAERASAAPADLKELAAKHRQLNDVRARKAAEVVTHAVVPWMVNWLSDRKAIWVQWLIEVHPKLKAATIYIAGAELHSDAYALRMAEAMLNTHPKLYDFAPGIPDVGEAALWAALEARDPRAVSGALARMELNLLDLKPRQRDPNASEIWARRLRSDFLEF